MEESERRIICLANSKKFKGRCLAGKLYTHGKIGGWIRPVSNRSDDSLNKLERQVGKDTEPQLLDILEFGIKKSISTGHQVENWLINPNRLMVRTGRISSIELLPAIDKPINLWHTGKSSKTHGKNDLVPENRIVDSNCSLYLIKIEKLKIQVVTHNYGYESRQVRGEFSYVGAEYNLVITDPIIDSEYKNKSDGFYEIENLLLTISLAETKFEVNKSESTGYYKLIAGVIKLPEIKNS
jgi:ATP-dependent DNA helicase RecQ